MTACSMNVSQREVWDSQASLLEQRPSLHQVVSAVDARHQRRPEQDPVARGHTKRDHCCEIAVSKLAHKSQLDSLPFIQLRPPPEFPTGFFNRDKATPLA